MRARKNFDPRRQGLTILQLKNNRPFADGYPMNTRYALVLFAVLAGVLTSCAPEAPVVPAPIRIAEYKEMGRADRVRYQPGYLMQYNLTRVHNAELKESQRLDSLKLVEHIVKTDSIAMDSSSLADLATLLRDEANTPKALRQEVLKFLLEENYPDLASHLIPLIGRLDSLDPTMRSLVLNFLEKNPNDQMLEHIVRSWAREKDLSADGEQGYRNVIQQISGQNWQEALLGQLNSPSFGARAETLEILHARVAPAELRKAILAMTPQTDTVAALQYYIETFDYLPAQREELASSVILYKVRRDMLPDAARLSLEWSRNTGYQFNIRDFHLLSRLARDPLRSNLKRTNLVIDLGKQLKTRPHVQAGQGQNKDNFWLQVDKLTLADLWNMYLLNEMLSRPRVQTSLKFMADGDLADVRSAWGGLVFYQNGQAEAILYPPDPEAPSNDAIYVPTERLITDERDALCRFIGHFERLENADRAGPTQAELDDAVRLNYYGLILTRIDKTHFAAHYFNPQGVIVSLGKFPMR